jgi:hypothetical protein
MTIDELIVEALAARDRFWFVQTLHVRERTDALEHRNGLVQDLIKGHT